VLDRLQRYRDPSHGTYLPGPHPGTVDDVIGFDYPTIGDHPGDSVVFLCDLEHLDALKDLSASRPGPFRE
jgi:hypothetical protein